jgi:broad specificity phosphatase PhoE
VRHGESEGNAAKRFQGQSETPLTARGRLQAAKTAEAIAGLGPISALYSSPLGRALDTARAIEAAIGVPIGIEHDLREIDHGVAEGRTWEELEVAEPEWTARLRSDQSGAIDPMWPGGETFASVRERSARAARDITSRHKGNTIVLVGHGGALTWFIQALLDPDATVRPDFRLRNASLTEITLRDGAAQLVRLDDVTHLDGQSNYGAGRRR